MCDTLLPQRWADAGCKLASPPDSPDADSHYPPSFDPKAASRLGSGAGCSTQYNSAESRDGGADNIAKQDVWKQAVIQMDIPDPIVQMAIEVQQLRNGRPFENVQEMYLAADEIARSLELQVSVAKELHEHECSQKKQKSRTGQNEIERDGGDSGLAETVEEDGMECETDSVSHIEEGVSGSEHLAEMSEAKESQPCLPVVDEMELGSPASPTTIPYEEPVSVLTSTPSPRAKLRELTKENIKLKERKLCRVCRRKELAVSGITFLPCGHFITCEDCAEKCDDCPACSKNIMGTVRTFLS